MNRVSSMEYEAVIGMEVHVQLLTRSKMFCSCSADYAAAPPNTHTCPVCTGFPGVLPVINKTAVEYALLTALALNCHIAPEAIYSRKSYFYPDLPKNYQISMYDLPLSEKGWLEIEAEGQLKSIGIRRVHLEEDTAKLLHTNGYSLVDFNRSGVPLLEIVSEPDIRTSEEARQYLIKLRTILRYLGVSTGDMEKGAMRCEANISLRPRGSQGLGTKVEVKNLNSFRAVKLALEYEIERQSRLLSEGSRVRQVTMGWDEGRGVTVEQRSKEEAHDYRYFPEPDLPPLVLSPAWVEDVKKRLPELPDAKRDRFMAQYDLPRYDAALLTGDRAIADYYERCVAAAQAYNLTPKLISNWVTGELFRLLKESETEIHDCRASPESLVELLSLVEEGKVNPNTAKEVLEEMFKTGRRATSIVQEKGLRQISDADRLGCIVEEVLASHPKQVEEYLAGKEPVLGWLIGQVMKATKGKANPKLVAKLLKEKLKPN